MSYPLAKYIQRNKVFQYGDPDNKLIGSFEGGTDPFNKP